MAWYFYGNCSLTNIVKKISNSYLSFFILLSKRVSEQTLNIKLDINNIWYTFY